MAVFEPIPTENAVISSKLPVGKPGLDSVVFLNHFTQGSSSKNRTKKMPKIVKT